MRKALGLLLTLLAALGCGQSDAEKFADAYCAEVAKCCAEASLPSDGKMCHMWFSMAGDASYNRQAGDACLAEMRSQVSAGTFCSGGSIAACDAVYGDGNGGGSQQLGQSCDFDDDCAGASEGKVACDVFDSKTCVALLDVGATCASSSDCVSTAYCDYQNDVCTARVPAGGDCVMSSECLEDHYCPSDTRKCAAQKSDGEACTSFSECLSGDCSDNTCEGLINFGLALMCGGS